MSNCLRVAGGSEKKKDYPRLISIFYRLINSPSEYCLTMDEIAV